MSSSTEELLATELSSFFTVLLGCSVICCVLFNTRLIWLSAQNNQNGSPFLHLSPYFLSSCCSEMVMSCIFGPVLCILITQKSWVIPEAVCAFLDCLFLTLFWSSTASMLVYSMDRHCLLVQRRFYPETFGKLRRNITNLSFIWITSILSALPYLGLRDSMNPHVPMTILFKKNTMYCVLATVILYLTPALIIIASLIKTVYNVKLKKRPFHHGGTDNGRSQIPNRLTEDFQTYKGLIGSSIIFISTSFPWVSFQLLKALELIGKVSATQEVVLLITLVFGMCMKTPSYVVCSRCIRDRFFSNLFRNNSMEFTIEPPSVVLTNIAAV